MRRGGESIPLTTVGRSTWEPEREQETSFGELSGARARLNAGFVEGNPFTSANRFCGFRVMSSDIEIPENRFARFSCRLVC